MSYVTLFWNSQWQLTLYLFWRVTKIPLWHRSVNKCRRVNFCLLCGFRCMNLKRIPYLCVRVFTCLFMYRISVIPGYVWQGISHYHHVYWNSNLWFLLQCPPVRAWVEASYCAACHTEGMSPCGRYLGLYCRYWGTCHEAEGGVRDQISNSHTYR